MDTAPAEVVEWSAACDWDGIAGVEGFEAMLSDHERRGWRLESVLHTLTSTMYGFTRSLR